jgi:hypothetical protein
MLYLVLRHDLITQHCHLRWTPLTLQFACLARSHPRHAQNQPQTQTRFAGDITGRQALLRPVSDLVSQHTAQHHLRPYVPLDSNSSQDTHASSEDQ